jgi:hypothetical protein
MQRTGVRWGEACRTNCTPRTHPSRHTAHPTTFSSHPPSPLSTAQGSKKQKERVSTRLFSSFLLGFQSFFFLFLLSYGTSLIFFPCGSIFESDSSPRDWPSGGVEQSVGHRRRRRCAAAGGSVETAQTKDTNVSVCVCATSVEERVGVGGAGRGGGRRVGSVGGRERPPPPRLARRGAPCVCGGVAHMYGCAVGLT